MRLLGFVKHWLSLCQKQRQYEHWGAEHFPPVFFKYSKCLTETELQTEHLLSDETVAVDEFGRGAKLFFNGPFEDIFLTVPPRAFEVDRVSRNLDKS